MVGKLFFTVGCPRSGKSTYVDEWVLGCDHETTENGGMEHPRVVIGGDDFRHAVYGREFEPVGETHVFSCMDTATRALLRRGFDVIIDETSSTVETIRRYLKIDIGASPIFIDTPEAVCIERAIRDGKPYLVGPIKRIAKQLEKLRSNWDETFEGIKQELRSRSSDDVSV